MIDNPLLGLSQRLPPSNTQAEQALLGALMANNLACRHVDGLLWPEHFVDPVHGQIFLAIMSRVAKSQPADAITLRAEFEHKDVLDEVGGTAYLGQLLTPVHGIINVRHYGEAIRDAWLRRQLIDIGEQVVNNAFGADPEKDGKTQVSEAIIRLRLLTVELDPLDNCKSVDPAVDAPLPADWTKDLTLERQIFGHMRGLCRTAAVYLDTALRFGILDGQRTPFENLRDMLREVEPIAAKEMNDAPYIDPLKDGAWFRDLLRRDAAGMSEQDGRGDSMLLMTGVDREEALALARFHDVEERGCRILNRFGEAEYHSARSERFWKVLNQLELEVDDDQHAVEEAASQVRNPADFRRGGEVVAGNVVDMQDPALHLPVALYGDDCVLIDVGGEPADEAAKDSDLIPMLGKDGVPIGFRKGPERSA